MVQFIPLPISWRKTPTFIIYGFNKKKKKDCIDMLYFGSNILPNYAVENKIRDFGGLAREN